MTAVQFREWMAKEIAKAGGQRQFAEKYRVDRAVVSLVLGAVREPSVEFAKSCGWSKTSEFKRIK